LLGHYTLRGGETLWIEGALPKAMKLGLPLICEEVDAAPAEANLAMQRALEVRAGKARRFYNARNGEEVTATEGFCILATANTAGGGDHSGLYPGTQVQNSAFRDRFGFERVTYPEADVETEILIRRTGLDKFLAEKSVEFANHARTSLKQGELLTPVSTRTLLAFATLYQDFAEEGMPQKVAAREAMLSAVIYKSANPVDEAALRELVQRIFGTR
jgi:cobaltochelatase CobS